MRKIHRKAGLIFVPFLLVSAVTGILWAYAPHTYLKHQGPKVPAAVIDAKKTYVSIPEVIQAATSLSGEGKVTSVALRPESGRLVFFVNIASKKGIQEIWVDAEKGIAEFPPQAGARRFHQWVMKMHKLSFFGTKKELTMIPGAALILMIVTGLFLLRRSK